MADASTDLAPAFQRLAARRKPQERFGEAWERQTGEPGRAWDAFVIYRDLGSDRTLAAVQRHLAHSKEKTISAWAQQWRWVERARAYDNHLDRRKRAAREQEIEEMERRQVQAGQALQGIGLAYVDENLRTKEQRARLSPKTALAYFQTGFAVERKARGVDDPRRQDEDEAAAPKAIDPKVKAELFDKIIQMHDNIAAVQQMAAARTATIPVTSHEVDGSEEEDGG